MQNQSEAETTVGSQRHAGSLSHPFGDSIQRAGQHFHGFIRKACSASDHERIIGVLREGGGICGQIGQLLGESADRCRQIADIPAGDELFIEVILLEDV